MPWWIVTIGSNGSPHLFGPYPTELKAVQIADERGFRDPEIVFLPTRDSTRATRILKERRTELMAKQYGSWELGMKKFRHPDKHGRLTAYGA
jgi:hypothetical protein